MNSIITDFGQLLVCIRHDRGMIQAELAQAAHVHTSHISNFEQSKRMCGIRVATRLADALHLKDKERVEFMSAAASTTKRKYLTSDPLSAENPLVKLIALRCQGNGLDLKQVVNAVPIMTQDKHQIRVMTSSGEVFTVEIKIIK